MLVHHLHQTSLEWEPTRQQFVSHDSECILITCRNWIAVPLFRSHVGRSAANGMGDTPGCHMRFGYAEIGELEIGESRVLGVRADEEVGGFDILVDNLLIVGMLESVSSLLHKM